MAYLIAILVSIALFAGFLMLAAYEGRRGGRLFPASRAKLDREVARIEFMFAHVDFASALRALAIAAAERAAHDIAHAVLVAVRGAERLLTHAVRTLRTRRASSGAAIEASVSEEDIIPASAPTPLARTMLELKAHLRRHPRAKRLPVSDAATDTVE